MKMKKNKKAILVACLAVCMMSFTACGSKSDKMFDFIDKGSYSEALDYYKDKIDGDSKERELRKEIKKARFGGLFLCPHPGASATPTAGAQTPRPQRPGFIAGNLLDCL